MPVHSWLHLGYFNYPGTTASEWNEAYFDQEGEYYGENFANTAYVRFYQRSIESYGGSYPSLTVIQYIYFYPYNDWWNNHEGDWQRVYVVVSSNDPDTATILGVEFKFHSAWLNYYQGFGIHPTLTTDFVFNPKTEVKLSPGPTRNGVVQYTHPVVYVGAGSHASYPVGGNIQVYHGGSGGSSGEEEVQGAVGGDWEYMSHTGKVLSTEAPATGNSLWERYDLQYLPDPDLDNTTDNMGLSGTLSWLGAKIQWGTPVVESPFLARLGGGNESPFGPFNATNSENWGPAQGWGELKFFEVARLGPGNIDTQFSVRHRNLPYSDYHHWSILGDETWSGSVGLYGDVVVFPGAELTIQAGTTVTFPSQSDRHQFKDGNNSLSEIFVYGTLTSEGTSGNQVVFRGPNSSDNAQHWGGIRIMEGGSEVLPHTQIRNAPLPTLLPTNLTAETGDGQATLRWDDPSPSPSDPSITGWEYRTKPESATEWGDWTGVSGRGTREALVSPLAYGVRHQFEVRAVNTTPGGGPSSDVASVSLMTVAFSASSYSLIESGNPVLPGDVRGQAEDPTQAAQQVEVIVVVIPATDRALTIPVTVSNGSAEAGDYRQDLPVGGLSLASGKASARFTITAVSDDDVDDETVQVGLGTPLPPGVQAGDPATATVTLYDTPSAPTVTAEGGDGSVTLSWAAAGNPGIEGWQYRILPVTSQGVWSDWKPMRGSLSTTTEHTVDGLDNEVTYRFQVRAYNARGYGDESTSVDATPTPPGAPTAPRSLTARAGNEQVSLSWETPDDNGSTLTGWEYRRSTDGGTTWDPDWEAIPLPPGTVAADLEEHTVEGLTDVQAYTFEVRAINAVGDGAASRVLLPAAPGNFRARWVLEGADAFGHHEAKLSWTDPADPSLSWEYRKKEGTSDWETAWATVSDEDPTGVSVTQTVDGLDITQPYRFQARVRQPAGWPAEAGLSPLPVFTQPLSVRAQSVAGKAQFDLGFVPPVGGPDLPDGSQQVSSANLRYQLVTIQANGQKTTSGFVGLGTLPQLLPAGAVATYSAPAGSVGGASEAQAAAFQVVATLLITGLDPGVTYQIKVRLVDSDESTISESTLGSLLGLRVQWSTAGSVVLSWNRRTDPGLTGWQYRQQAGSGSWGDWQSVPNSTASTTSHTVSSLTETETYRFQVRALVPGGPLAESFTVSAPPKPLVAPGNLHAEPGHASMTLRWDDANNARITGWQYQQRQAGEDWGAWQPIPGSTASTTSYTVTDLTNGVSYRFRVRALAGSQQGPFGKSVGGPPNGLRAQALNGSVELVWADPSDSRIAGWQYRVREGQDRWSGWQPVPGSTASTTSYTVPDLTNGVSYRFRVRGVASNGRVVLTWPMVETSPDGSLAVPPPVPVTNGPPEITSGPSVVSFDENVDGVVATYTGTDPDSDALTWTLGGADVDTMEIDASGRLSFREPPPDFEDPGDMNGDTVYEVTVTAGDGSLSSPPFPVRVSLTNVDEPGTVSLPSSPQEGLAFTATLTDPDGDVSARHEEGNPDDGDGDGWVFERRDGNGRWQLIPSQGGASGAVSSLPELKSYTPTEADVGHLLRARVSYRDGHGPGKNAQSEPTAAVTPARPTNEPPMVSGVSDTTFAENGAGVVATYVGTDPEGTPITWSLGGADADTMRLDASGRLRFRAPPPDYESPGDANADTVYEVTVTASDGSLSSSPFPVRVRLTNIDEPGTVSLPSSSQEGLAFTATLTDPDGDVSARHEEGNPDDGDGDGWVFERRDGNGRWQLIPSQGGASGAVSTLPELKSYTPTAADVGHLLRARVSYRDGHGPGKSAQSEPTGPVTAAPPPPPQDLPGPEGGSAVSGWAQARVSWRPVSASPAVSGYDVHWQSKPVSGGTWPESWTSLLDNGAGTDRVYRYRVRARRGQETGGWSGPLPGETGVQPQPGPATGVTAARGDRQVRLAWTGPDHAHLTGWQYRSGTVVGPDTTWASWRTMSGSGASTRGHTVPNLTNGRSYTFRVRALNAAGQGAPSEATTAVTPAVVPSAPGNLGAAPGDGDRQMRLSWERAADNGSALTGYQYRQSTDGGATWAVDWRAVSGSDATTTSHVLRGLSPGAYTFEVRALNGVGEGVASDRATGVWFEEKGTGAAVSYPSVAGRNWTRSGVDAGDFTLSSAGVLGFGTAPDFEEPVDADTDNVYRVRVEARESGAPVLRLEVVVRVTNVDEEGTVTLSPTAPRVGQDLTASLSDPDGGEQVTGWTWYARTPAPPGGASGAVDEEVGTSKTIRPSRLLIGKRLRARANYTDAHGPGKQAASAESDLVVGVPTAPRDFEATPGNGQVSLRWSAPSSNGGSEITGYEHRHRLSSARWPDEDTWTEVGTAARATIRAGPAQRHPVRFPGAGGERGRGRPGRRRHGDPSPTQPDTDAHGPGHGLVRRERHRHGGHLHRLRPGRPPHRVVAGGGRCGRLRAGPGRGLGEPAADLQNRARLRGPEFALPGDGEGQGRPPVAGVARFYAAGGDGERGQCRRGRLGEFDHDETQGGPDPGRGAHRPGPGGDRCGLDLAAAAPGPLRFGRPPGSRRGAHRGFAGRHLRAVHGQVDGLRAGVAGAGGLYGRARAGQEGGYRDGPGNQGTVGAAGL